MASRESEALPSLPFVFLLGWVYFYDFFSHLSFFWPFFFFFFSSCVYVSMCFVFSAGSRWGVLACSNFPPKTWAGGRLCDPHPGTKEQGVGRNLSYPRYQDWPAQHGYTEKERKRETRVRSATAHTHISPTHLLVTCFPHPRPVITCLVTLGK